MPEDIDGFEAFDLIPSDASEWGEVWESPHGDWAADWDLIDEAEALADYFAQFEGR